MIEYALPDFADGFDLNMLFVKLLAGNPEMFLPGVHINNVYGCFPSCVLNGGRTFIRERYSAAQMDETMAAFEEYGVKTRLTFTNMLADEAHLEDPYVTTILDVARKHDVEVIVYSDLVDRFIKQNYGFKRVLSTTREILDADELNEAARQFDYVVLNYNMNKDSAFLDAIECPGKIEIMPNELCNPGCPFRSAHYLHNSQDQLDGQLTEFRRCDLSHVDFCSHMPDSPTILTNEEIAALNRGRGFRYFKLVGRGVASDVTLESYLYYLVAPMYREPLRRLITRK